MSAEKNMYFSIRQRAPLLLVIDREPIRGTREQLNDVCILTAQNLNRGAAYIHMPTFLLLTDTRTADYVATAEQPLRSQEDKPQTHHTVRETAREIGIHRSCIDRIIRKDVALKCIKRSKRR